MTHDPSDRPGPPAADAPDPDADLAAALVRSRVLEDAPEAVIRRALDLFPARPRAAAPAPGPLRRLVAVLGFDSAAQAPQALGLRAGGSGLRQMLFTAEGRDVDLRLAPGPGGWRLSGQVLGPDAAGRIELRCGAFHAEQAWNELAEFHLDGLPEGQCHIVLHGDGWALELPPLQIPGGAA